MSGEEGQAFSFYCSIDRVICGRLVHLASLFAGGDLTDTNARHNEVFQCEVLVGLFLIGVEIPESGEIHRQ